MDRRITSRLVVSLVGSSYHLEPRDLAVDLLARRSTCSLASVSDEPSIDPQFTTLVLLMEQHIPFNKLLGLRVDMLRRGECVLRVPWMDHLIGDTQRPAVH